MSSTNRPRQTRRDFLKVGGSAALGVPLLVNRGLPPLVRARSCVVLGAGLSGLSAAYALKKAGWAVTVVEARDRVGGRVLSHSFKERPDLVSELGGEWIGASHERILALCRELGIELQHHRFVFSLMRNNVIAPDGSWHYSLESDVAFEKFKKEYRNYGPDERAQMDKLDWWSWLLKVGLSEEDVRLRSLINSADFGESTRHVSACNVADRYFKSSQANEKDFKIKGGNSRLPRELAARLGEGTVRLNSPVEEVRQGDGFVYVRAGGQEFRADACVCTIPMLVLYKIRFDPPLPSEQFVALKRSEYSRIVKNNVLFSERFWGPEYFALLTDATCRLYFHGTQNQPGPEGILSSYAMSLTAEPFAAQPESKRLEQITHDLLPVSPHAPQLARAIASHDWPGDPYAFGAMAFYRPGSWLTARPVLQRPHGKVLFAGEHLADWQGTMEGAVATGEQAARELTGAH